MPMPAEPGSSTRSDLLTASWITGAVAALVALAAVLGSLGRPHPARKAAGATAASARQRAENAPAPDDPAKPEGPEDLHRPTLGYSLKKTVREFGSDQCTDIAATLVYYSVLALGPGLIAIVSILGLLSPDAVGQITEQFLGPVRQSSRGTYEIITQLITNATTAPGAGIGLVIGIAGALWSASGYVGAFSRAMNRIYGFPEGRPIWKLRPTQLLVTLIVVVLVVAGALILVSAGPVVRQLAAGLGVGEVAYTVFQIAKWPVLVLIAIAAVAILYYFAPNVRQPKFKWTSAGSVLALVVWALATLALGAYLTLSGGGSYAKSYGPIAGVIVFLLWLWITNLALLFGAEFDAELERSRELQAGLPAEETIQLPPRDTRQSDKKAAQHRRDVAQARRLRETRGRAS